MIKIAIPAFDASKLGNYRAAIEALGAQAVCVGADCDAEDCAGLLLPGGGDIDPALCGQKNTACMGVDRALDEMQMSALARFVVLGKPVLGVCRGHQLINVFFGGTLIQHLPESARHSWDADAKLDRVHNTHVGNDSFLYMVYGASVCVNSAHHQAVDRLGEGLIAEQWSDDGVIEGMRHDALPVYGVQWHPERMGFASWPWSYAADGRQVLAFFLRQCRDKMQ